MQLSLFGQRAPHIDDQFRNVVRFDLGAASWLHFAPGWLQGHEQLEASLLACAQWEIHERQMYDRVVAVPRRIGHLPDFEDPRRGDARSGVARIGSSPVDRLSGRTAEAELFRDGRRVHCSQPSASGAEIQSCSAFLTRMSRALSARYGRKLCQITLGHYRNGQDSVAPHGDRMGALRLDTVVAICSVGVRRRFSIRPAPHTKDARIAEPLQFSVGEGDLIVMGGACQHAFLHWVPKCSSPGERIAIMFREAASASHPRKAVDPSAGVRAPAASSG